VAAKQVGAAVREDALSDLHPMAELLASCPGMTKENVYYLEQRRYIRPIKQRHGKIERNLYTTEQLELVKAIWRHRQAGDLPREAYQRALREQSRGQLSIWPDEAAET
jgi:DNA-binding transcriptional MerR regulator